MIRETNNTNQNKVEVAMLMFKIQLIFSYVIISNKVSLLARHNNSKLMQQIT